MPDDELEDTPPIDPPVVAPDDIVVWYPEQGDPLQVRVAAVASPVVISIQELEPEPDPDEEGEPAPRPVVAGVVWVGPDPDGFPTVSNGTGKWSAV